jgi:hypothetical protein
MLGACRNDAPPPPTAEQSDQLNEAEDMLNEQAVEIRRDNTAEQVQSNTAQ